MKRIPLCDYPADVANALLQGLSFVSELRDTDAAQYAAILNRMHFMELRTEEAVMRTGERDSNYYFLLRGQLLVYPQGDVAEGREFNRITPGQSFGALSILCGTPRSASVLVSHHCATALLLALDLSGIGALDDFSVFSLPTKLTLYRTVAGNTRWQLEVYKMDFPDHPLTARSREIEIFMGKKNTLQELESLDRQVRQLNEMILAWNEALSSREKSRQDRGASL